MFAGLPVTVVIFAGAVFPVLGLVTLAVSALSMRTRISPARMRTYLRFVAPMVVRTGSRPISNLRFLCAIMRRPPDGLRLDSPCQIAMVTPVRGSADPHSPICAFAARGPFEGGGHAVRARGRPTRVLSSG